MQGPYDNQGIVCPWFFVLGLWEENLGFQWCDCPIEISLRQPFEREKWHVKPHTHATLTSMEKKRSTKGTFRQIDCAYVSIDGSKYGNFMCEACASIVFESDFLMRVQECLKGKEIRVEGED